MSSLPSSTTALIPVALNNLLGKFSSFAKIIGCAASDTRIHYYTTCGKTTPENAKHIRLEIKEGLPYPGTKISFMPPGTPELLVVDEYLISSLLTDFKSQYRKREERKLIFSRSRPPSRRLLLISSILYKCLSLFSSFFSAVHCTHLNCVLKCDFCHTSITLFVM